MLVALPLAVARIVDLCNKGEARFTATLGVQVTDNKDGSFKVVATDGKFLGIIQGELMELPEVEETWLNDIPSAIVDAKDWKEIFAKAGKTHYPESVVIWSDGNGVILQRYEGSLLRRTINSSVRDGKFPPWEQVMPQLPPFASVRLDVSKLADQLKCAASILVDDGISVCDVGFYPTGRIGLNSMLVGLSGRLSQTNLTFDGLLVPLEKPIKAHEEEEEDESEVSEEEEQAGDDEDYQDEDADEDVDDDEDEEDDEEETDDEEDVVLEPATESGSE